MRNKLHSKTQLFEKTPRRDGRTSENAVFQSTTRKTRAYTLQHFKNTEKRKSN